MSIRIFAIPFDPQKDLFQDEDLSRFVLNKQIRRLHPEFFQVDGNAYWTVFVEYETILTKDPAESEGLDTAQRLLFQRLKEWRKDRAEKEGVPVFIIATNKQLLDLVKRAPGTLKALSYAYQHKSNLPAEYLEKTAEYATEAQWNLFRSGGKEEATQEMLKLSQQYPGVRQFQEAKDKMVVALLSDTADIPLPKPLPDQQRPFGGQFVAPESEVLKIQSARSTLDPRDDAYALIVGIRRYRDLNGPRFADNDARQVQRLMTKMAGFRNDPAHTRLRLDSDATISNLYDDLHWLLRKAKLNPDAKVFFYFSGHGSPVLGDDRKTIKDGLLVPYEASLDNLNDRTAVSLAFLKRELGKLPNRDVVCVIDACFSGSGKSVSGMKLIRPEVDVNLLSSNKLFISASAADRPAEEYTPGQQGAFTYFFLKGLMGDGDDNKDGWVDTQEAYGYACGKLKALGLEQNPQMSKQTAIRVTRVK
jgi:hypothetical protein